MDTGRAKQLQDFVNYAKSLDGDEKGEAQVFLDRLFKAFSRSGYKEAGAKLEQRVKNDTGGTSFADLVWKPIVLIEMKKRGVDLSKHLTQAFDYWVKLAPNRPRYVVLCNFDEFRIYDFDQDINEPQDTVAIDELPERYGPLNFLWPTNEKPKFRIDREKVTREAADILAAVYKRLASRKEVGPVLAQRFALQCLVCLFSEDIGLLPKHFFTTLLDECIDPPKAFDLFDGLFRAMNSKGGAKGGRFKEVAYFNGGIFAESAAVELDPEHEVAMLKNAAAYKWNHISPDIFGTIFQHSMEAKERHAFGAHYTSPADIMKIVRPTIVEPFMKAIDAADSIKSLTAIRDRLTTLRILDPACGSGNFLYIAYREMRRLEATIILKQSQVSKREATGQGAFAGVSPRQFFGMDILPFAVELAKVTLSLAPKLSSDELHTTEPTLPLFNLDKNIQVCDALISETVSSRKEAGGRAQRSRADWPDADVIIGNPPFLGAKRLKPERGADYVNAVRDAYPEVPGMADYCVYWFRRANDHLPVATAADPFRGRAGLVGTQNIRNNQSRIGGLDQIVKTGTIVEAVDNQPWSGEANVHVSIANWVKTREPSDYESPDSQSGMKVLKGEIASEASLLIPGVRKLWFKVDPKSPLFENEDQARQTTTTKGKRGKTRSDKSYELAFRDCRKINSALSDEVDLSNKRSLTCNKKPKRCFQGKIPGFDGFMLDRAMLASVGGPSEVVVPYLTGREMLDEFKIERWAIDFGNRDMAEAAKYDLPFAHVRRHVLPAVKKALADAVSEKSDMIGAREEHVDRWWQFWNRRDDLSKVLSGVSRYLACSRVSRRPIFVFLDPRICPSDLIQVFAFEDDYSFGILQSTAHLEWTRTSSRLKIESDIRYSVREVFESFPWPQQPAANAVSDVAKAGVNVREIRRGLLQPGQGLRNIYRLLDVPGRHPLRDAHEELDEAVLRCYGFRQKPNLVEQLYDLNQSIGKAETMGTSVTRPGIPSKVAVDTCKLSSDRMEP